jgi:hypothetical protein
MKVRGLWLALVTMGACIKAPELIVVDQATALEQQAAGSFEDLERDLFVRAAAPQPVPLTPNELEALGIKPRPLVDETEQTEADRIDALLRQRCIGEGREGFLVDTHQDCIGAADRVVVVNLIERTNRARAQLFRWMHAQQPTTPLKALREAWREEHLRGVVCEGWIQRPDGTWEAKPC